MLTILVTGASGLIGGALCAKLAAGGHRIVALAHRRTRICGNDGSPVPLDRSVRGDICAEGLGLDAGDRAALDGADLVIHCAASTRFDQDLEAHRAINVEGTARIVELTRDIGARLMQVSTAYVCGMRDGPVREEPVPPGTRFANGYEASKAEAEALVRASGLRHAILRPSIVLGENESGRVRTFGAIYGAFRLLAEGRVTHMPAAPGATLDFVPLDHVVDHGAAIAERMEEAEGGIFHAVAGQPMPVETFIATIVGYPQFARPTLVDAAEFDPADLPPRERRLFARALGPYASYFQRDPRFDDSAARAITGRKSPPCDAVFLRRQIDFAIRQGFLPDR